MDQHALDVLGFAELRSLLATFMPSTLGRRIAEALRPSTDAARLSESLNQVGEARDLSDRGSGLPTAGLGDVVSKVRQGQTNNRSLEPEDLVELRRNLDIWNRLAAFTQSVADRAPSLDALGRKILDHRALGVEIDAIVEAPGQVKDRASTKLWDLRQKRTHLEERIRALMVELVQLGKYRPHLQERNFSVRNGRYVLAVRFDRRGNVPGILHDKSASGETAFVEPTEVVALSNDLSDVLLDESREVGRLLLELSKRVYADEARLHYSQEVAAWLDYTAGRARMSQELDLVPVKLVKEPMIRLVDARHPLLHEAEKRGRFPSKVVPLTVSLGLEHRMIVITGPNTGGKTVALKTVGLLQLMFQSGLHLPVAHGSELPCLRGVFADIGDEQSLAQSLSTFSGHIRNITRILTESTPDRLILLDELGAGTDPVEGAALGESILDRLLSDRALVMVTTHLGSLKAFAYSKPGAENACVTFDEESLRPTYNLVVGQPGSSQALAIAERFGLDPELIEEARARVGAEKARTEELMTALMRSRVAAEAARSRSQEMVAASEIKLKDAERHLEDARGERARVEREAEAEVLRIVDDLKTLMRPHLNALKNVPKALVPNVAAVEQALADHARMTPFRDRRNEFLLGLKKHDEVYVPRFAAICRIEKLHRTERRLTVRVGQMAMEIAFDDVSWVTPPDAPRK